MDEFGEEAESSDINIHNVPILLDLAFAINVRYLGKTLYRNIESLFGYKGRKFFYISQKNSLTPKL